MKLEMIRILLLLFTMLGCAATSANAGDIPVPTQADGFAEFRRQLIEQDGFEPAFLAQVFAEAKYKQNIIDAITRPAEGKPWKDYRKIFVTEARIKAGQKFMREHADTLARAEKQYGVPSQVIAAIIGVETYYGRYRGSYRAVDALVTLGFYYPKRAEFFRRELRELLLLAREDQRDPLELMGSYAGAMGFPQFIPSSFRAYAVDFDGNGRRDFWSDPVDAIGSIGNYLSKHGWKQGEPITAPVRVADAELLGERANSQLKPDVRWAQLRSAGVSGALTAADEELVSLLRLDGEQGDEYWVGQHNFYMITRYNHSRLYAMAVYQLSEAIRSGS